MARKKVDFAWWGNTKHLDIPEYCLVSYTTPSGEYESTRATLWIRIKKGD